MQVQTAASQNPLAPDPKVPVHVAIIMDGNGRWAAKRGLPRIAGHKVGVDSNQSVLESLMGKGVQFDTLYALSTQNWNRQAREWRV